MQGAPLSGLVESLGVLDRARRVLVGLYGELYVDAIQLAELETMASGFGDHPDEYLGAAHELLTAYKHMLTQHRRALPHRMYGGNRYPVVEPEWLRVSAYIGFGDRLLLGMGVSGWGLSLVSGNYYHPNRLEAEIRSLLIHWLAAIRVPVQDDVRGNYDALVNVVAMLHLEGRPDDEITALAAEAGMEVDVAQVIAQIFAATTNREDPYRWQATVREGYVSS